MVQRHGPCTVEAAAAAAENEEDSLPSRLGDITGRVRCKTS